MMFERRASQLTLNPINEDRALAKEFIKIQKRISRETSENVVSHRSGLQIDPREVDARDADQQAAQVRDLLKPRRENLQLPRFLSQYICACVHRVHR